MVAHTERNFGTVALLGSDGIVGATTIINNPPPVSKTKQSDQANNKTPSPHTHTHTHTKRGNERGRESISEVKGGREGGREGTISYNSSSSSSSSSNHNKLPLKILALSSVKSAFAPEKSVTGLLSEGA